jgi:predicted transposase YbfD/YdcC
MSWIASLAIKKHFRTLKDPRRRHRRLHRLLDIVAIAICAVTGGADDWEEIAAFGRRHHEWFKKFLALPHGIPSHDTIERVFARLDTRVFQTCLRQWLVALSGVLGLEQIAIDGKTLRGSRRTEAPFGALHLVSAWATRNHLSLGEIAVDGKSNEITAIPKLLELLELKGALVTIDAMGCQKEIVAKIRERGGHYLLTVKDNQQHLLEDIQNCFVQAHDVDYKGVDYDQYEVVTTGHGRHEKRHYTVLYEPAGIRNQDAWVDLRVVGMCYSERTMNGVTSSEARYFIGDQKKSARYYGIALRNHWGIENRLHWQLDVSFAEDANRTANRQAAENLSLVRRTACTLVKRHPSPGGIRNRRRQAGWDTDYLEEILRGGAKLEKE